MLHQVCTNKSLYSNVVINLVYLILSVKQKKISVSFRIKNNGVSSRVDNVM